MKNIFYEKFQYIFFMPISNIIYCWKSSLKIKKTLSYLFDLIVYYMY